MDSTSLVMSPVDIKKPNFERYPRFASKVGRMIKCDIAEGDALFLPSFWSVFLAFAVPLFPGLILK
jgi:jumonji domain-containing protein 7